MTKQVIANEDKITELLFIRGDISTRQISDITGLPYVSVAKYRTGERKYTGINMKAAIKLTTAYDKLTK